MSLTIVKERVFKYRMADSSPVMYNRTQAATGKAYDFDGTTSKIAVGNNAGSVKTICFWINPDIATTAILELNGSASISLASNVVTTSGFTSPTIYVGLQSTFNYVTTGVYTFVAITTDTAITASAVNIGLVGATYFDGKMSGLMMYDTALTVTQLEAIFSAPGNPIPSGLTSSNLLAFYPMSGGGSTPKYVFDASPTRLAGVPTACTAVTGIISPYQQVLRGYSKKSFFDGTDDHLAIGSVANTAAWTFSAWVIADSFGASQYLCSFGDLKIALTGSSAVTVYPDGTTPTAIALSVVIPIKKLFHIVVAQSGTIGYVRVNGGTPDGTTVTAATTASQTSYIGRSATNYFNGFIDQTAFHNSFLSATNQLLLYASTLPTSITGCTHYYKNSASTTWVNVANPGTNDGALTGSPTNTIATEGITSGYDIVNAPLQFANSNFGMFVGMGYVTAPSNSSLEITASVSVDMWVKVNTTGVNYCLMNKRNMYALRILSTNVVRFQTYNSGAYRNLDTTATLTAGVWHHIAATYTSGTTKIYINGALSVSSASFSGAITSSTNALEIGREYDNTELFDGYIDDVKIYNTALTASQVLSNYRAATVTHT